MHFGGNRSWVPLFFYFTQFGGAFHCLNFSKFCGTASLIKFFYPSNAIRYTKSTELGGVNSTDNNQLYTYRVHHHSILSNELYDAFSGRLICSI